MEQKYFQCRPGELCDKAECCTALESVPGLTIGDYYRLSRATNQSMAELWRTKGSVTFEADGSDDNIFLRLSLLHDHCPYLDNEFRCQVYKARPMSCATFPEAMYAFTQPLYLETATRFRCLRQRIPSPESLDLVDKLSDVINEELSIEKEHFWKGKLIYFSLGVMEANFAEFSQQALDLAHQRDPKGINGRANKIGLAIAEAQSFIAIDWQFPLQMAGPYLSIFRPVVYSTVEDIVAENFDLDTKAVRMLEATSKRIRALMRQYPGIDAK